MKVKVYVLSFIREYSDDIPFCGVEGVFTTDIEARTRMEELYNDVVYGDPAYDSSNVGEDEEYEGDFPDHELRKWSAEAIGHDYFGWNWNICEQELDIKSTQFIPDGLKGSWIPSIEDFEMRGWEVGDMSEEKQKEILGEVNTWMNENEDVSECFWIIIDQLAEEYGFKKICN